MSGEAVAEGSNEEVREGYKEVQLGPKTLTIPEKWDFPYFNEAIERNPRYDKPNREVFDFVPMDAVSEEQRTIDYWTERKKGDCTTTWFKNGDTIYGKITPCAENGKIAFVEDVDTEVASGSTEFLVFHPKEGITDPKFVFYLANMPQFRSVTISLMEGSTGRQRIPNDIFESNIRIPVPRILEQRRIADLLSTVDEEIRQTSEVLESTVDFRQGLMEYLLTKGLDHHTHEKAHIGPKTVDKPKNWDFHKFDEVIELNPRDPIPERGSFDFLPMDAVNEETRSIDYWEKRDSENCTSVRFRNGDVVYAKITPCAENGKIAYIDGIDGEIAFGSTEFLVFRGREGMNSKFVYYLSNFPAFRSVTISLMEGSTGRQRIPTDIFEDNLEIPVPPLSEQERIVEILLEVDRKIQQEREKNRHLKELKRGLMQDLLTGKVRIDPERADT